MVQGYLWDENELSLWEIRDASLKNIYIKGEKRKEKGAVKK